MLLVVPDAADESSYLPALESVGYLLRVREPDWCGHRLLEGPDTDANPHVFSSGNPRSTGCCGSATGCGPTTPTATATRVLARRLWRYVQDYADAKTEVVAEIMSQRG
ncbi:hypothetical protein ABT324_02865 [Saccharopolyspora sp. NPDC000359]|uniref:hypothetical protein n=1 Tax=Saccharopolyspora sp. NPDC000359 TaxID=3154251 RepID=UPI00331D4472